MAFVGAGDFVLNDGMLDNVVTTKGNDSVNIPAMKYKSRLETFSRGENPDYKFESITIHVLVPLCILPDQPVSLVAHLRGRVLLKDKFEVDNDGEVVIGEIEATYLKQFPWDLEDIEGFRGIYIRPVFTMVAAITSEARSSVIPGWCISNGAVVTYMGGESKVARPTLLFRESALGFRLIKRSQLLLMCTYVLYRVGDGYQPAFQVNYASVVNPSVNFSWIKFEEHEMPHGRIMQGDDENKDAAFNSVKPESSYVDAVADTVTSVVVKESKRSSRGIRVEVRGAKDGRDLKPISVVVNYKRD